MPEPVQKLTAAFDVHKVTILFFVLFSVNSLASVILAALTGAQWSELDAQSRFMIVLAITANWTGVLMAFFRSSINKLAAGQNPLIDTAPSFPPAPPPPAADERFAKLPEPAPATPANNTPP